MTPVQLESDRPCVFEDCGKTLVFDENLEKWVCKDGHIQKKYGFKKKGKK